MAIPTKAELVEATEEHARALAPLLRPEELAELEASGVVDPLEMMLFGVRTSDRCLAVLLHGQVGAILGVGAPRSVLGKPRVGQLWFLTGTPFLEHPRPFMRVARQAVAMLLEEYPVVHNIIDGRYTGALLVADSLGAEFGNPIAYGPHSIPFVPFCIRREP